MLIQIRISLPGHQQVKRSPETPCLMGVHDNDIDDFSRLALF